MLDGREDFYKGMTLINPLFGFSDQSEAQRQVPLLKTMSYFVKTANIPNYKPPSSNIPYFYQHWISDPLSPTTMSMRSYIETFNEVMKVQEMDMDFMSKVKLPSLMILGARDKVIC